MDECENRLAPSLVWASKRSSTMKPRRKYVSKIQDDQERGSHVYFIHGGEYVKIGIAFNPKKRLTELQTSNPFSLILLRAFKVMDARAIERSLHSHYAASCVRGEWFKLSDKDIERIMSARSIVDVIPGADV